VGPTALGAADDTRALKYSLRRGSSQASRSRRLNDLWHQRGLCIAVERGQSIAIARRGGIEEQLDYVRAWPNVVDPPFA
jgi:hypothetical protein